MNRPLAPFARRGVVVLGLLAVIALGAITVRAAAAWTAASTPPSAPPVSVATITDQLAAEQARSADLEARLEDLAARAIELTDALKAANDRVVADAATADTLRAELATARKALTRVQGQVAKANARLQKPTAVLARAVVPSGDGGDDDDEHDDD